MFNTCALFMCSTRVLFLYVQNVLNMCLTRVDIFPVYPGNSPTPIIKWHEIGSASRSKI